MARSRKPASSIDDEPYAVDLSPLVKSLRSLRLALRQPKDEFIRDSVIQRFEFTYEISWKLLKRVLEQDEGTENVDQLSRRDLFRLASEKGILANVTDWFAYHRARNETSHAYSEAKAEEVYAVALRFARDAGRLLRELERRRRA